MIASPNSPPPSLAGARVLQFVPLDPTSDLAVVIAAKSAQFWAAFHRDASPPRAAPRLAIVAKPFPQK